MENATIEKKSDWLKKAKKKLDEAFDEAIYSSDKKRIRITLSRNPMQVVEVDPDLDAVFDARNVE